MGIGRASGGKGRRGGEAKIVEWARQPRDGEKRRKKVRRENVAPPSNVLIAAFSPITIIP